MANGKTNHELIQEIIKEKERIFEECRCSDDYVQAEWEFDAYLEQLLEAEEE